MPSPKSLTMYNDILDIIERRSTCIRVKVAAILVKDDRIVSTGWNGVPAGHVHCEDIWKDIPEEEMKTGHHAYSTANELHAEQNCLAYAAKHGIATNGATMYLSISCCMQCSKLIIAAGIAEVYYKQKYDRETAGLDLMKTSGIFVSQIIINQ